VGWFAFRCGLILEYLRIEWNPQRVLWLSTSDEVPRDGLSKNALKIYDDALCERSNSLVGRFKHIFL
jgi:hypothetical protein